MYTPTLNKKPGKTALSGSRVTFNRQRRTIEKLRDQIEALKNEFEEALALYHSALKPKEKKAGDLITQFVLKINDLAQPPKALNKKERKEFRKLLKEELDVVFGLLHFSEIHDDLNRLYKEVYGKSHEEEFHDEMSDLKTMFAELGLNDIDLSDLNPKDNLQDMLRKVGQSMHAGMEKNDELPPPPSKPKTKKELAKEQKVRELEALQNKGLNSIYKRLAKGLHPDLEQDLEKRIEKEVLMKRLTTAYSNQDLISLLEIESEWLGTVEDASETLSEESFKVYNSLLKEQIEDLKQELRITVLHHRYIEIHKYVQESPEEPLHAIEEAISQCDFIIDTRVTRLNDISGEDPLKCLKIALAEREEFDNDDFFPDFGLFMDDDFFSEIGFDMLNLSGRTKPRKKK